MDKKAVGKRIRQKREKMSLTREEFAEMVEISPQFLAEIENGKKGISAETLYKICTKTNASADYILVGRQAAGSEVTPAVELLMKIPPIYSGSVESIIGAIVEVIETSDKQNK